MSRRLEPGTFVEARWPTFDRFLGFEARELLDLQRVLAEQNITLADAIARLRADPAAVARIAAWRRHYGLLADLEVGA